MMPAEDDVAMAFSSLESGQAAPMGRHRIAARRTLGRGRALDTGSGGDQDGRRPAALAGRRVRAHRWSDVRSNSATTGLWSLNPAQRAPVTTRHETRWAPHVDGTKIPSQW